VFCVCLCACYSATARSTPEFNPNLIIDIDGDCVGRDPEELPPLWIPLIGGDQGMPAP
jgi:hypothetical protein